MTLRDFLSCVDRSVILRVKCCSSYGQISNQNSKLCFPVIATLRHSLFVAQYAYLLDSTVCSVQPYDCSCLSILIDSNDF